jgi:hypothetical protein
LRARNGELAARRGIGELSHSVRAHAAREGELRRGGGTRRGGARARGMAAAGTTGGWYSALSRRLRPAAPSSRRRSQPQAALILRRTHRLGNETTPCSQQV